MLVAFSFPFHTLKGHGGGRRCTFPGCDKGARDKFFCKFDDVLASRGEGFVGLIRIQILSELPEKKHGGILLQLSCQSLDQGVSLVLPSQRFAQEQVPKEILYFISINSILCSLAPLTRSAHSVRTRWRRTRWRQTLHSLRL